MTFTGFLCRFQGKRICKQDVSFLVEEEDWRSGMSVTSKYWVGFNCSYNGIGRNIIWAFLSAILPSQSVWTSLCYLVFGYFPGAIQHHYREACIDELSIGRLKDVLQAFGMERARPMLT
jgi:hypothetical protein